MVRYISLLLFIGLVLPFNFISSKEEDSKSNLVDEVNLYQLGMVTKKTKLKKSPKALSKHFPVSLDRGDTVKIIDDNNSKYVKVEVDNQSGWLSKKNIEILKIDKELTNKNNFSANKLEKKTAVEKIKEKPITKKKEVNKPKEIKNQKNIKDDNTPVKKKEVSKESLVIDTSPSIIEKEIQTSSGGGYTFLWIILVIGLGYLLFKNFTKVRKLEKRFKPVLDIEKEVDKVSKDYDKLRKNYKKAKSTYDSLHLDIEKLSDDLNMMSNGLYEPRYDFGTSDQYKEQIKKIRVQQKTLIRNKQAVPANSNWEINGSKREGKKFINRQIRIALRAFNGESDSIISKVRWNNVDKMEERIEKSCDAIDKLLETSNMYISRDYVQAKIDELYAVHEYLEKKHDEQEEIRRIRADEREENKVLQELEKAKKEAEKEEKLFNEALAKAREQLGLLSGDELSKQEGQIKLLEQQLAEALEKKERAISRAQITKSGHVYVISNIGSFGEDIYKIGLTRRLEPEIRVKELGDASVPFSFDIHAMVFSQDAPALEKQLHEKFNANRVNLVNRRKEYFKLDLDMIKEAVLEVDAEADFISTSESREYKETKALIVQKQKELDELENGEEEKFPEEI